MKNFSVLFSILCVLLFGSCQKRYWFRAKIDDGKSKRYSVKVKVINQTPELLSDKFLEIMRKSSIKELKRKGYFELPIDSPQFIFELKFKVDSFNAGIKNTTHNNAVYSPSPQKNYYTFKRTVKAILFTATLKNYKQGWTKWEVTDDIYYFGEYRDIGRSEGMVRGMIKNAKPE